MPEKDLAVGLSQQLRHILRSVETFPGERIVYALCIQFSRAVKGMTLTAASNGNAVEAAPHES